MDLRNLIRDVHDVLAVSHPSTPLFVNTYTNAYELLLTYDGKYEVCKPESDVMISVDKFERCFEEFKDVPTKMKNSEVDGVDVLVAGFDMTSYALFSVVVYDSESRLGDFVVFPSPMGVTPENALRSVFGAPLTDRALIVGAYWASSILGGDVGWKVDLHDSDKEIELLDRRIKVKVERGGVSINGSFIHF